MNDNLFEKILKSNKDNKISLITGNNILSYYYILPYLITEVENRNYLIINFDDTFAILDNLLKYTSFNLEKAIKNNSIHIIDQFYNTAEYLNYELPITSKSPFMLKHNSYLNKEFEKNNINSWLFYDKLLKEIYNKLNIYKEKKIVIINGIQNLLLLSVNIQFIILFLNKLIKENNISIYFTLNKDIIIDNFNLVEYLKTFSDINLELFENDTGYSTEISGNLRIFDLKENKVIESKLKIEDSKIIYFN